MYVAPELNVVTVRVVCHALPETRYRDRKGRPKRVRYWLMEPVDGEFVPNNEVDEVRWVRVSNAGARLSYAHDTRLIESCLATLESTADVDALLGSLPR